MFYGYFREVSNAGEVHARAMEQSADFVAVNPAFILDVAQVAVAATRALRASRAGTLDTKSVWTDILFKLSPSSNILGSLQRFGTSGQLTRLFVATFDRASSARLRGLIKGQLADATQLAQDCDRDKLLAAYKVQPAELKLPGKSPLLDAVITRIAAKEPRRPPAFIRASMSTGARTKGKRKNKGQKRDRSSAGGV